MSRACLRTWNKRSTNFVRYRSCCRRYLDIGLLLKRRSIDCVPHCTCIPARHKTSSSSIRYLNYRCRYLAVRISIILDIFEVTTSFNPSAPALLRAASLKRGNSKDETPLIRVPSSSSMRDGQISIFVRF